MVPFFFAIASFAPSESSTIDSNEISVWGQELHLTLSPFREEDGWSYETGKDAPAVVVPSFPQRRILGSNLFGIFFHP